MGLLWPYCVAFDPRHWLILILKTAFIDSHFSKIFQQFNIHQMLTISYAIKIILVIIISG